MTEFSTEDQGRLSLADVQGDWSLTHVAYDEQVPDGIEITLQEGDAPGDVTLAGVFAVTRMACPAPQMAAEQRYLQALQGLGQYSFLAGTLSFAPAQPSDAAVPGG